MTVAEVDALLYLPGHPRQQLLRALRIAALSPGWQASFRALLDGEPGARQCRPGRHEPASCLARLPAADRRRHRARERRSDLHPPRGSRRRSAPGSTPWPVPHGPDSARGRSVLRNYSMSGPPGAGSYRITVKREHDGTASGYLHTRLAVGDQLDIAAPRGTFILDADAGARAADQRRHRRDAGPRDAPCAGAGAVRARDLVAAWRAHQTRPLLRRRGAHAACLAPERPHARLLQPPRSGRPRRP